MWKGADMKGVAYATLQGNVYYDLTRSKEKIGILSHQTIEGLMEGSGTRVDVEKDKRYPLDFVLWKIRHRMNRAGIAPGAGGARGGTSNARSCQ